jgi:RNA polymerase sigma factor (sigma-70 family)
LFDRLIRRLPPADSDRVSDAELLARFAKDRDQTAFELLVWRHGSLVLGACRRILRDEHRAEDAFQATFLVLARQAGSLRPDNVPGWLHRVARRVAARAARQAKAARETVLISHPAVSSEIDDLGPLIDAEVARLPERYRLPVVLCYLQDRTTAEAARLLRVPKGTVLSRLSTARQRLAARLSRRGVALPATLVAATMSDALVTATTRSAAAYAAGAALVDSTPTLLATEVIRMSAWKLPAAVAAGFILLAGIGTGVGALAGGRPDPDGRTIAQGKTADPAPEAKRADALKRLVQYEQEVLDRIHDLDKKRNEATRAMGDDVDVKVLLASLEKTDRGILEGETDVAKTEKLVRETEQTLRTYDFSKVDNKRLETDVAQLMSANGLIGKIYDKQKTLAEMKKTYGPDHPIVKAAADELDAAQKEDEAHRERFRGQVKQRIAEADRQSVRDRFTNAKSTLQAYVEDLEISKKKRAELVKRIARARSLDDANQLIEDELRVYRELRQQLLRQRLILQIGVDGLPTPTGVSEGKVEQLTKEVAELKAEVRRLGEAKKPGGD